MTAGREKLVDYTQHFRFKVALPAPFTQVMSSISALRSTALSGVHSQTERFAQSAARVTQLASEHDSVNISSAAREAASGGATEAASDLTGAMVDMGVGKYLSVANLKVLKASDELDRTLMDLTKRT